MTDGIGSASRADRPRPSRAGGPSPSGFDRPSPSRAVLRAFVRRQTHLRAVPDVPGVRLHLADDVMAVCSAAGRELGDADPPLPYWAFAWAGGLAIARYVLEHPETVAGRTVVDLATGSGLCAIVALAAGASSADGIDIDPLADAAVALNARANGVHVGFSRRDPLDGPPPRVDVILAGDVCYEETMAERTVAWLRAAAAGGTLVLLGDPGRAYLPPGLERRATYRIRTTRELEDREVKESAVYAVGPEARAR